MRITFTALLAAGGALLLLPLSTAAYAGAPACDSGPVELVGGGGTELLAGQEHVQGYVLRRRLGAGRTCVVPGAAVELLARTTGQATAFVARTGTTDADGRVQFRVRPPYTVVLTGRSVAGGGFAAVTSPSAVLVVGTRLTLNRRQVDACHVAASGSTYPAKPDTPVEVLREQSQSEVVRVGRFLVRPDGTWSGTVAVPCGSTQRLLATIQQTARNALGSSDNRVEVATRTRECGSSPARSGPAGTVLTQTFDVFNTTTALGGAWWGERVVSNRTDKAVTFRGYSSDGYRLLRRGSSVAVGMNAFNDAILVTEHRLAPGEELREVVVLEAANCLADPDPGVSYFALPTGPAFPAGTAVVGMTVLRLEGGVSVSDRVALMVT